MANKSKTTIKFFGGLRTIGGTVVSVEYKDSRVIFDFGFINNLDMDISDKNSLNEYLEYEVVPIIDGVYNNDSLKDAIISAENYVGETAVLISHLHIDHMGAIGFIDSNIPVYMTEDGVKLYKVLEEIGEHVVGGLPNLKACSINESFSIGEIKITPVQVDHDILGACAFYIETPDGIILYSGDLRLHGKNPDWTKQFIYKASEKKVDALIMEATTLRSEEEMPDKRLYPNKEISPRQTTEINIPEKITATLGRTKGLGIFNLYHRNVDRIKGMMKAAVQTGRRVVFEPETAYIVNKFLGETNAYVYQSSETLKVLEQGEAIPKFKEIVFSKMKCLTATDINKNPRKYFIQNSYINLSELFMLDVKQSVYIHSNGIPLGDYDPAYSQLLQTLDRLKIDYERVGTSGHATPSHLAYIAQEINPETLIPLHSFHPERLKPKNGIQLLPEYGVTYQLDDHEINPI